MVGSWLSGDLAIPVGSQTAKSPGYGLALMLEVIQSFEKGRVSVGTCQALRAASTRDQTITSLGTERGDEGFDEGCFADPRLSRNAT